MPARVDEIGPAGENSHRETARIEAAPVGAGVDPESEPGYDRDAGRPEAAPEGVGDLGAIRGWPAGADERDRGLFLHALERLEVAKAEQHRRRIVQLPQRGRVGRAVPADRDEPSGVESIAGRHDVEAVKEFVRTAASARGRRLHQFVLGKRQQRGRPVCRPPPEQARDARGQVSDQEASSQTGVARVDHAATLSQAWNR